MTLLYSIVVWFIILKKTFNPNSNFLFYSKNPPRFWFKEFLGILVRTRTSSPVSNPILLIFKTSNSSFFKKKFLGESGFKLDSISPN
jgi:hypothetical protein